MPRNNRSNNTNNGRRRRGGRNRRNRNVVGYHAPVFRVYNAPQAMNITLHANGSIGSGGLALNGGLQTIIWNNFNDGVNLATIYKYFEILSCRIRVSMSTTTAATDSFYQGAVAYYPINYTKETVVSVAPTSVTQVEELPGSVYIQYGAKNFGNWFYPEIKEQFSCSEAFGTSNRQAGSLIWYVDDLGISESFANVDIQVNLRFTQREYSTVVPSLALVGASRENNGVLDRLKPNDESVEFLPGRAKPLQKLTKR
jgi:hypothetical protein